MSNYVFNKSDPAKSTFVVLQDQIDGRVRPSSAALFVNPVSGLTALSSTTSLTLAGEGITNYGQLIQNNLVYLMEHFANRTRPLAPVEGQIWYKNANYVDSSFPSDPTNAGLYVWSGTTWTPIVSAIGGALDMNGAKVVNLGSATASTDALSLGQADSLYFPITGGTLSGNLSLGGGLTVTSGTVTFNPGVAVSLGNTPTIASHVTNKSYVDAADASLQALISTETTNRINAIAPILSELSTLSSDAADAFNRSGDVLLGTMTINPDASINVLGGGTGSLSFGTKRLQQVGDPLGNQDAATKLYVDGAITTAIAALPPSAASDGVVSGGSLNPTTGTLTLTRTQGLPSLTISGAFAPFTHLHGTTSISHNLSSTYNQSTLAFTERGSIGFPNTTPLQGIITTFDKEITNVSRPIRRRVVVSDGSTATFNLTQLMSYVVNENRLQVYKNGIKQYMSERGRSTISFTGTSLNINSVTGLAGAYNVQIAVNGGANQTVTVNASGTFTFYNLVQSLITSFTTLSMPITVSVDQFDNRMDIHLDSNTSGTGSSVVVSYSPGELFTAIASSSAPVNKTVTTNLQYVEVGTPGSLSNTVTMTSTPSNGDVFEFLVLPG